jgi:virulence factor Mce-like protein
MSRARRPRASIVANPVLVGAVTTLVIVVAVFLAYNANNGLPFVPTRQLNVLVSNGANLVKGNEVRSGGFRVGVVTDMTPVMLPDGKVGAKLTLKLDRKVGPVPVDSHVVIRPRSALGLKYVELDTGSSKKVFGDGATMPAGQAEVPVELDELYNMFDEPTRRASQGNLKGFGDALAARGSDLNRTIQVAPALFDHLDSVMANLSDRRTHLTSFFKELGDAARIVAPVSRTNAHLFTSMANTFEAFSRDPQALKDTISKSPPTLRAGTSSLRVQRPFLEHTAALSRDLDVAATELRGALPTVNSALRVGTPVQRRSVALNDALQGALGALEDLVKAPTTVGSLRGLTATVGTLQPQVRFLGPYVTVCNNWNMFWTFTAEHFTAPDDTGSSERALLNMAGTHAPGSDNVGNGGANEFAHGEGEQGDSAEEFLHNTFNGPAVDKNGNADCGAGQTGYVQASNPLRDKSVKGDPYQGVVTEHYPVAGGRLGPTYAHFDRNGRGYGLNPDHVPAGETFTNRPGGRGADIVRPGS